MVSEYSCSDRALIYGITGGIPMYLEQFSPELTIRENLLENLFDRNAVLFEEPSNLLKQELREPAAYNAVITAVASGKRSCRRSRLRWVWKPDFAQNI